MLFLWLLAGHFLGDFSFQPDWMAKQKGESWEITAYHALIHAAVVLVVAKIGSFELSSLTIAVLLIAHFLVDPLKSRWKLVKSVWLDQLLHIAILGGIVLLGI